MLCVKEELKRKKEKGGEFYCRGSELISISIDGYEKKSFKRPQHLSLMPLELEP